MAIPHRKYLLILSLVFAVWLALLAIKPWDRHDWLAENAIAIAGAALIIGYHKKLLLSRVSYTLIFIFMCLHQVGAHYVVISDKTLAKMSQAQKDALFKAVKEIRPENRKCVDDETKKILDEWRADPTRTVIEVDQVDRAAFISKAEAFFKTYYKGANLTLYNSIRASA